MSDPFTDPDVPALQTRLTREYGLRHPFVGAGMGFIAHEQLAAAVTNAGGLGVLGASPDPAASLIVMVERLRALTCGPFGVDLPNSTHTARPDNHLRRHCIRAGQHRRAHRRMRPAGRPAGRFSPRSTAGPLGRQTTCRGHTRVDASLIAKNRLGSNRTRCRRDSGSGQRGGWPCPRTHPVAHTLADDPSQVA